MITTRAYYRGVFLVPILLPVGLLVRGALHAALAHAATVLWHSLPYFLGPYLGLAMMFLGWSKDREDREIQRAARLSPLLYAGIITAQYGLDLMVPARIPLPRPAALIGLPIVAVLSVMFGYICVGFAEFGYGVLTEAGVVALPRVDSDA